MQLTTLSQGLQAEKASRSDLEMYVAVLNTQKAVMQEDKDKMKLELQEGKYGVNATFRVACFCKFKLH